MGFTVCTTPSTTKYQKTVNSRTLRLQSSIPMRGFHKSLNVAGTGHRATVKKTPPLHVGRGPVPRHAAVYRTIAGDRPPRYGTGRVSWSKNGPLPRRARACPSQCVWLADRITAVGQDRLKFWHICQAILTRSGSGEPELQRWARCAPPRFSTGS